MHTVEKNGRPFITGQHSEDPKCIKVRGRLSLSFDIKRKRARIWEVRFRGLCEHY